MSIKIDKLIRSKRRSISLEITRDARLIVRIPKYADLEDVKQFILEKEDWIQKKIAEAGVRVKKATPKRFISGEEFHYLGEKYKLLVSRAQNEANLIFNNGFYLAEEYQNKAREIFIKWYKRQAKINIPKRVQWYAAQHNLKHGKIKITSAGKRWGSCSAEGNINFTWKLILLPIRIIDYVVVHELAHLKQHNHSKKFWLEVEKMLPDYKERRKWLKKFGDEYSL